MNSKNSKKSESHRFRLDLTEELDLKDPKKSMNSEYNNNNFKISAPTWNNIFDLPNGFYSIADIQDYFEFIIKKHETLIENPPVETYPNKTKTELFSK